MGANATSKDNVAANTADLFDPRLFMKRIPLAPSPTSADATMQARHQDFIGV